MIQFVCGNGKGDMSGVRNHRNGGCRRPRDRAEEAFESDPVQMYLMQMSEIPLLTRPEEIAAAERIEAARRRFRRAMLANSYSLAAAVAQFEKVRCGALRPERLIEVSVSDQAAKGRILMRMRPNLHTVNNLLERNR